MKNGINLQVPESTISPMAPLNAQKIRIKKRCDKIIPSWPKWHHADDASLDMKTDAILA
jgi:hypothetical protein